MEQQYQQQERQQEKQLQNNTFEGGGNNYTCPNCGALVDFSNELCPHCKHPLHPETCTYCGAAMEPGDEFCCECGNPRKGIICPQCGTLNFRCFCSRCNAPLDELALAEIEKAKRDPIFQKAQQLAVEMAELEEKIMEAYRMQNGTDGDVGDLDDDVDDDIEEVDFETVMDMTEEDKQLMERYRQVLGSIPVAPVKKAEPKPVKKPAKVKVDKKARVGGVDIETMKAQYEQQLREMQGLLNSMQPDYNATPQMQRNFCCAHKVVVTTQKLVKKPTTWICNFCGCEHNQPSECARPELGGVWKYNSYTVTVQTIETR